MSMPERVATWSNSRQSLYVGSVIVALLIIVYIYHHIWTLQSLTLLCLAPFVNVFMVPCLRLVYFNHVLIAYQIILIIKHFALWWIWFHLVWKAKLKSIAFEISKQFPRVCSLKDAKQILLNFQYFVGVTIYITVVPQWMSGQWLGWLTSPYDP